MNNKKKIKLPDFNKDQTWIELKKKMGIKNDKIQTKIKTCK